jgi:hypothetical protein
VRAREVLRAALSVSALAALSFAMLGSRTARAQCAGRPTDASGVQGYAYASEARSFAQGAVRVHYALTGTHAPDLATTRPDGVPDTVAIAAEIGDGALRGFAARGFRAVPSDAACTSNGGDAKVDVYFVRFAGADGATIPESCRGAACASFVLVDATFKGRGYATPNEGFTTVVTHELFHAVQNAYDAQLDRFWAEGTAQWATKALHPELQDFERQLPAFFAEPARSLDAQPSGVTAGFLYGSAVFPLFLETWKGEGFVKEALEAESAGSKAIDAVAFVLAKRGSSLAEAYPLFGAWNAATKDRAGTGGYPAAASYPGVKSDVLEDGASAITSGLGYHVYAGTLDARQKVSLETDPARNAGVLVPLEGGKARLDRAQPLPAVAEGDVLVVVAGVTAKKSDAPFTLRLGPDDGRASSPRAAPASGGSESGCAVSGQPGQDHALAGVVLAGLAFVILRTAAGRGRKRGSCA